MMETLQRKMKCGSALSSSDRHKAETVRGPDLYRALTYGPEELGAAARQHRNN